jgi:hypothetical protein
MAFQKASRPAAGSTANGPRELAHTGKRRGSLATTIRPESQALARIADHSLVAERLGVAIELARLDEEPPR